MKKANSLKTKFEAAAAIAVKSRKKESVLKANKIKEKVAKIKKKIDAIKCQIAKAPTPQQAKLIKKKEILKGKIQKARAKFKIAQQNIVKVTALCKQANQENKEELLKQKEQVEAKVAKIMEKMQKEKKKYLLLKLKLEEKSKKKVEKQKTLTKGLMDELAKKLKVAKEISDGLKKIPPVRKGRR